MRPGAYAKDGAHYFTSASGRIRCAILARGEMGAGCQMFVKVANLPQCSDMDSNAPMAYGGTAGARARCANQGCFITEGAAVLPYGSSIAVSGYTCTSSEAGMRCVETASGRGFTMAVEGAHTFRADDGSPGEGSPGDRWPASGRST
ncbi:hypothetical protein GCM10027418_11470 [Mariniluteicoccus endophyticus]